MPKRNNPFQPNSPVHPEMFAGRIYEIERIESSFLNTKDGNPTNLLIVGERGIGKTSLLLFARYLARGDIPLAENESLNFISVYVSLDRRTGICEFAKKLKHSVERELRRSKEIMQALRDIWSFVQRVEIAGTRLAQKETQNSESELFDNLIYSIVDTAQLIKDTKPSYDDTRKDGILIFIDEADNARDDLDIGGLLKLISEKLIFEGCSNVSFIVSGLPEIRNILRKSHESSLRLFEELELEPLSNEDRMNVIYRGIKRANQKNDKPVAIEEQALYSLIAFSEGYPHFLQQFAYSAYEEDNDYNIDEEDFKNASWKALDRIGDRYYKEMYYGKIEKDSYRQVLRIMSEKFNDWITKAEIRSKFKGDATTLNNAINALIDRNIILRNPTTRGQYRLQWMGFALWIRFLSKDRREK